MRLTLFTEKRTKKMEKEPKISVLGSLHTDLILKVNRMPKLGETIIGDEFYISMGGKGANQAVAAARLGGQITHFGKVGDDYFGEKMIENLKREGISTKYVEKVKNMSSSLAFITVDAQGNNFLIITPGTDSAFDEKDIEKYREVIKDSDVLLCQLEIPVNIVHKAIEVAYEYGKKVIFNLSPARKVPDEMLKKSFILVVNEIEAESLLGIKIQHLESAKKSATKLLEIGAQNVILTIGKEGAILVNKEGIYHVPGVPVNSIDTTGAGDAFCGALAVMIASEKSLREATEFANFAGAFATTKIGAQEALPTRKELEEFIREHT